MRADLPRSPSRMWCTRLKHASAAAERKAICCSRQRLHFVLQPALLCTALLTVWPADACSLHACLIEWSYTAKSRLSGMQQGKGQAGAGEPAAAAAQGKSQRQGAQVILLRADIAEHLRQHSCVRVHTIFFVCPCCKAVRLALLAEHDQAASVHAWQ